MKRLFYFTKSFEDAEAISNEVHDLGIDDHHFYVVSRNEKEIKTHKLHGSKSLENTQIIATQKRANISAVVLTLIPMVFIALTTKFHLQQPLVYLVIALLIFVGARVVTGLACASFDDYFRGVFDDHLERGEILIVIDVERSQSKIIEDQLNKHPAASFIAEGSNVGSPIPT
ncbi:hypothetical protein J3L16_05000 [Alteromonas sp. 5E99-2]|uniref:hypothetical protein n=1 Tax=Alteromonas sp. 5E99-2 TaxID=2817683 RepID=UPI001A99F5B6|nr:hypothetical protein [Alteromonas sp. 5E99-2]MBO1255046.1 hypothetical protein [Alteromonas sp. 5E99-2]